MTFRIKGDPKQCPNCASSNFTHLRTNCNSRVSSRHRNVIINKDFFCNECNKYFFGQDEESIKLGAEKYCNHEVVEKSYCLFYYPGTKIPHDGIAILFCLKCYSYLLACSTIKNLLEEAWPNFWDYTWAQPLLYCPMTCKYCTGEAFEDTLQEISHAKAKALVLLKNENRSLFDFLYKGDDSGIINLEKSTKQASEEKRQAYKEITDKQKEFHYYERQTRNYYRERFNLPRIGEGWISETKLFELVKKYFEGSTVYFHYRQSWLNGLELDIFIPDKKLAIEYMGKQHYEPVSFFGGEDSYLATAKRDQIKKELCISNGINLIYFDYQTEVTKENLRKALEKFNSIAR